MYPKYFIDSDIVEKVRRMIQAHTILNGEAPTKLNVPMLKDVEIDGVKIEFYLGDKFFSMSHGHVVHHEFKEHKI